MEQIHHSKHCKEGNNPASVQIKQQSSYNLKYAVLMGHNYAVLDNFIELYMHIRQWIQSKNNITEEGVSKRDDQNKEKGSWIKSRVAKEKKERQQRQRSNGERQQERVSMFETSHWFLLSGVLVSQELDCSTLPVTDSWPAVQTIPWSGRG